MSIASMALAYEQMKARALEAEADRDAALRAVADYDREVDALSHLVKTAPDEVDAREMAELDLPGLRKRHASVIEAAHKLEVE